MRDPLRPPGSTSPPLTPYQTDTSQELTQLPGASNSIAPPPVVRSLVPFGAPVAPLRSDPPPAPLPSQPPPAPAGPDLFASVQVSPSLLAGVPTPPTSIPTPPPPRPAVSAPEESEEPSLSSAPRPLPCTLRTLLAWHKAHPGGSLHEELAKQVLQCLAELHARAVVVGERFVPENLMCSTDGTVRFEPQRAAPPRIVIEQYSAPELFRGSAPSLASDVFAAAAIAYECLAGRTLKVMFIPMVLQVGKTDTWFSDPGASMQDPYKTLLRKALSSRASLRHADGAALAEDFQDAWKRVHSPALKAVAQEVEKPFWNRGSKAAVIAIVFLLLLAVVAFFPVERFDQVDVPTVRPSLEQ